MKLPIGFQSQANFLSVFDGAIFKAKIALKASCLNCSVMFSQYHIVVEPTIGVFSTKMDGENNGSKPNEHG